MTTPTEGTPTGTPTGEASTPPSPPAGDAGATGALTQAQVNAIVAREADQAARAARKRLLEELGLDSVDALKGVVQEHQQQKQANMTAQEQAAQAQAELAAIRAQAQAEAHGRSVDRHLIAAGVPFGQLGRVSRLIETDAPVGSDEAAITTAIATLKADLPGLFATTPSAPPPPASEPGVGGPPPAPSAATGLLNRGRSRAQVEQGRTTP